MYIGKVISKSKTLPVVDFVEIVPDFDPSDTSVPTLIIGKSKAESIYGKDRIKVLDKKIEENVYWTFAKNERRIDFEEDLESFNNLIIEAIRKHVEYEYYNLFTEDTVRTKRFIDWLYNGKKKIVYISGRHIYLYLPGTDKVFGISLNDIEYIGKNADDVLDKIKSNKNNIVIYDDDFISQRLRLALLNQQYLIPFLYFLKG